MVHAWLWPNPGSALALGCAPQQQQQQRQTAASGRGVRPRQLCLVAAVKKHWEETWDPREVTLDEAELMQLEMRRLLGESRDLSIAKLVAKKLNPSATNLEVEKIVKQRGVKTFLQLVKRTEGTKESEDTKKEETVVDEGILLSPRPALNTNVAAPRDPHIDFEWPREADQTVRNLNDDRNDSIQLSPKPRGRIEPVRRPAPSPSILPSALGRSTSPAKPVKPVPELHSRPSRGGGTMEVFPNAATANPPPKPLPVPSLSSRPERPSPLPIAAPHQDQGSGRQVLSDKPVPDLSLRPAVRSSQVAEEESTNLRQQRAATARTEMPVPCLTARPEMRANSPDVVDADEAQVEIPVSNLTSEILTTSVSSEDKSQQQRRTTIAVPSLALKPNKAPPISQATTATRQHAVPNLSWRPETRTSVPQPVSAEKPTKNTQEATPSLSAKPMVQRIDLSEETKSTDESRPDLSKAPATGTISGNTESENGSTTHLESSLAAEKADLDALQPEKPDLPRLRTDAPTQEEIDRDWALAEVALDTKTVQEVVFVGSNAGGMIARFGNLNGFIPGKDLLETRGLKTFRAWARERGHDANHTSILDSSNSSESTFAVSRMSDRGLTGEAESQLLHPVCDSELDKVYREERLSFLSSLIGERANVTVTYVDKTKKKLVFSERRAALEDPEVAQRRARLMAKLKTGDTVKGKVRNISLFGVFVELVEGVSGLMHFSELSWTPVSDPAKFVNVGQEIVTLVHKLDYDRQRIYLSLKRMSPDPLLETVESMLARNEGSNNLSVETAFSIPELEILLQKLNSRSEIQEVVKGRRLHSASVVPSFQVYLSSVGKEEGFQLLARYGNAVQEVLVRTTLERNALKSIISEYTTSVDEEML